MVSSSATMTNTRTKVEIVLLSVAAVGTVAALIAIGFGASKDGHFNQLIAARSVDADAVDAADAEVVKRKNIVAESRKDADELAEKTEIAAALVEHQLMRSKELVKEVQAIASRAVMSTKDVKGKLADVLAKMPIGTGTAAARAATNAALGVAHSSHGASLAVSTAANLVQAGQPIHDLTTVTQSAKAAVMLADKVLQATTVALERDGGISNTVATALKVAAVRATDDANSTLRAVTQFTDMAKTLEASRLTLSEMHQMANAAEAAVAAAVEAVDQAVKAAEAAAEAKAAADAKAKAAAEAKAAADAKAAAELKATYEAEAAATAKALAETRAIHAAKLVAEAKAAADAKTAAAEDRAKDNAAFAADVARRAAKESKRADDMCQLAKKEDSNGRSILIIAIFITVGSILGAVVTYYITDWIVSILEK